MIARLKRGVSTVRARNSTFPTRCPSPGCTTTIRSAPIDPPARSTDVEVPQEAVVEAVDDAVHREVVPASPRILDDRRLTDVGHLLDHVELAEAHGPLVVGERGEL